MCLDVGGTEIKAAPVGPGGGLLGPVRHFPARAGEPAERLLDHFAAILEDLRQTTGGAGGVRMAFPGPFDYENGVCLLRGLDKYDALYGVSLRQALALRLALPEAAFRFCNDVAAFALGEMGFGAARGAARAMFWCIGTGCGSAFGVEGGLAPEGTPGVPPRGYVYPTPFMAGCIDDYISKRGLLALTREQLGTALEGKALAGRAERGDPAACRCFLVFGQRLREAAAPFLRSFRPDRLCLGGQITRSGHLFLGPLEELCRELGVALRVTSDTSLRTLQGLSRL